MRSLSLNDSPRPHGNTAAMVEVFRTDTEMLGGSMPDTTGGTMENLREKPSVSSRSYIARQLGMDVSTVRRYCDKVRENWRAGVHERRIRSRGAESKRRKSQVPG